MQVARWHSPILWPLLSLLLAVTTAPAAPPDALAPGLHTTAGGWEGMGGGMDGSVNDAVVYRGQLIAVGGFSHASGQPADRIARWNGSAWEGLPGGGADGGLSLAAVYRDRLFVVGSFDTIGGVSADGLAQWDGNQWAPLPGELFDGIDALIVHDGKLIVAGYWLAGGAMKYLAAWDGSTWQPLGTGLEDDIDALAVHDGALYAASTLPFPASGPAIWRWDGATWSLFEGDIDGAVLALASHGGELVAAGRFEHIGGIPARRIARASAGGWVALGEGLGSGLDNQIIRAVTSYGGQLWAGGYFQLAGGVAASNIAAWDGNAWLQPGSGADSSVTGFLPFAGALVAHGSFTTMDGQAVHFIARWHSDEVFVSGFDPP